MMKTAGDELVQRLTEWGAELVFGYLADGINGILGTMNRAGDRPAVHPGPGGRWASTRPVRSPPPARTVQQLVAESDSVFW
jgi:hypothetical protein